MQSSSNDFTIQRTGLLYQCRCRKNLALQFAALPKRINYKEAGRGAASSVFHVCSSCILRSSSSNECTFGEQNVKPINLKGYHNNDLFGWNNFVNISI